MQNETQNQDTQAAPQQPVMEEAQAAPEQAMDDTQAATSEVHDDPGISQQQEQQQGIAVGEPDPNDVPDRNVTMYPEDLSGPETAQEQPGLDDGISIEDISKPLAGDLYDSNIDYFVEPVDEPDWSVKTAENPSDSIEVDFGWGFDFDLPVAPEGPSNPLPTEPTNTGVVPPWLQEPSGPFSDSVGELGIDRDGNGIEDRWEEISPTVAEEKDPIGDSLSPDTPEEPTPGGYDDMLGISKEDIEGPSSDTDGDGASDLDEAREDATPGGYDGSGIAGGLGIDYYNTDDGEESDERSPDVISEEEDASETKSDFTDADYQEVLDDLDNGNLDDVREFLEGLGLSDEDTEEAPQHAPGVPDEDGKLVDEGISIGDIVGEEKSEEGLEKANSTDEYTYDEDAYEDAEGAMKDLQHALKHGDEEERAEALEKLQGYLGGFDKDNEEEDAYDEDAYEDAEGAMKDLQHALKHGDEEERAEALEKLQGYLNGFDKGAEKDQDGTETQDGKIPSDSKDDYGDGVRELFEDSDGDGVENYKDSDHYRDGNFDFEDSDGNGILDLYEDSDGDGTLDVHEDSDGDPEKVPNTVDNKEPADTPDASGAAVGAGAAGEAGGLDEDLVKEARDLLGDMFGGSDAAPDASGAAVSGPAVGAAGAAGAGVADQAMDAATAKAGSAIDEHLGVEGSGKVLGDALEGNWDAVATGADKIIQESTGISGVDDTIKAISEEKWEELPGEFGEVAGSAVGAYFGGDAGAAVGA